MKRDFYLHWLEGSSLVGGGVWLYVTLFTPQGFKVDLLEKLFLFAPLVVIPLALALVRMRGDGGRDPLPYRIAVYLQPMGALALLVSYLFDTGLTAACCAVGWFLTTVLVAVFGLTRLRRHFKSSVEEISIDVGLIYIVVGGFWTVISRLGIQLFGFDEIIILLTATHFHYAGLAAPILVGLTGRFLVKSSPRVLRIYQGVVAGILIGIPLLAAGISLSPLLEVVAAILLAGSLVTHASLVLTVVLPQLHGQHLIRTLLCLSSIAVVFSMILAVGYSYEQFSEQLIVGIPRMIRFHGAANAFGFVFCGLLSFLKLQTWTH